MFTIFSEIKIVNSVRLIASKILLWIRPGLFDISPLIFAPAFGDKGREIYKSATLQNVDAPPLLFLIIETATENEKLENCSEKKKKTRTSFLYNSILVD